MNRPKHIDTRGAMPIKFSTDYKTVELCCWDCDYSLTLVIEDVTPENFQTATAEAVGHQCGEIVYCCSVKCEACEFSFMPILQKELIEKRAALECPNCHLIRAQIVTIAGRFSPSDDHPSLQGAAGDTPSSKGTE